VLIFVKLQLKTAASQGEEMLFLSILSISVIATRVRKNFDFCLYWSDVLPFAPKERKVLCCRMCEMRELESLEQEMKNLLVQDESYWRQNDAKFRAVAQNVSYDQFEEIGMAHLSYLFKNIFY
jgi:hypothetical protein